MSILTSHAFWEVMGLLLGIFLIVSGMITLRLSRKKLLRNLAGFQIGFGVLSLIVDGGFLISLLI